jgi:translocation and assembly module TamB
VGAVVRGIGWAVLGVAAALGVALSALVLVASSEAGRPLVASRLVELADTQLAGSLALDGIAVLPRGGIEIRGLRVFDPDGHLVLAVDRARVFADATRLRNRSIGLTVELSGPSVLLEEEPDGGISLARAFAPAHPSPRPPSEVAPAGTRGPGWALRVDRLTIRDGEVWWVDAAGATRLEARDLDLDGRALLAPARSRVQLRAVGAIDAPVAGPLALELRAALDGAQLRVPVLRARLGETGLAAVGEWNLDTREGRVALPRVGIDPGELRKLAPGAKLAADLEAVGYAESDGRIATAAVTVAPRAEGRPAGRAHAAAAARLDGAKALGADLVLEAFDPARLLRGAPSGALTLAAHGGAAGVTAAALRGRVAVQLAKSRLRGAELGPGELSARVDRGTWDLARLVLAGPGVALDGNGRWAASGPVSGRATVQGTDLAALRRNLATLLDAELPALDGRATVDVTLGGTAAAPALSGRVDAPFLRLGATRAERVRAELTVGGTRAAPTAAIDATADRLRRGGDEVARAVFLRGMLAPDGFARVDASASVPAAGRDPVSLSARGRRAPGGEAIGIEELAIAYPGRRYTLVRPATLTLRGPRLDRLELGAGPQRIALSGGLGPRPGALDARLELDQIQLEGLPAGLLPAGLGIAGTVSADLRATGTPRAPRIEGRVQVAGGGFRNLHALSVLAELRWDGAARRAALSLGLTRGEGGAADVMLELPVPLAGRPGEPLSVRVRGDALPLDALLAAAEVDLPATGRLTLDATLSGSVAAPSLRATAALTGGAYDDLGGVGLDLSLALPGERLDPAARGNDERLRAQLEVSLGDRPALRADGELPLDPGDLLARPGPTLRVLRTARLEGTLELPGLDLALLSGRLGLPEPLAGRLAGRARIVGTPAAPRGEGALELTGGAALGYAGVGAHLDLQATATGLAARGRATIQGDEALRIEASLGTPLERLDRARLRSAPVKVDATVPRIAIARAGLQVPLTGTIEGHLTVEGTPGAPRIALDLAGVEVAVEGRPLGDPKVTGRWAAGRGRFEATLAAATGGAVVAKAGVDALLSIDTTGESLLAASAHVELDARGLDLGFLPAVLPGTVRAASGKLEAQVRATGPLRRLAPRGSVRLDGGRVAVTEYGEWTAIAIDATMTDDAVELRRLEGRRGRGRIEARGALRGMASGSGALEGRIEAEDLTVTRAGMDLATLDLGLDASGSWRPGALDVTFRLPKGTVKLPRRTPRTLQSLERRPDIVIGKLPEKPRPRAGVPAPGSASGSGKPFALTARLVSPGRLFVTSDSPRIQIELKGDVTYELQGSAEFASGTVEVVRGNVEPIGGRNFEVQRGKVTFTGGPPKAAMLDVEAIHRNPAATVTVAIAGPLSDPEIRLTSVPPMDEGQIALLIATGRTDLKAGSSGVSTVSGEEAGRAALGAVATQVFKDVIADKLPLDTVGIDSGSFRAGTYFTEKNIYVGYTRQFEAQLEKGENQNEVRLEVPLSQRWNFEFRWGDANSGGGGLIWSRDY